jgi:pimeloyl-ACP methyl ester carboxylesterase
MEMAARIAAVLLIVLSAATLLAYAFQRILIYYPTHASLETLAPLAKREDLLPWRDAEGNFIGWHTRQGTGIPILILHGNAGHALHRGDIVSRLNGIGIDSPIYILEYPGYGARSGTPTESNLVASAVQAMDLLGQEAILLGESLGTGVACAAASLRTRSVRGLILVTPFDSLITVAEKHYPLVPVGLILRDRYQSSRALQTFSGPLAIIMAEEDDVIPGVSTIRLFESYSGPKKLWRVTSSGHNQALQQIADSELRSVYEFAKGD